MFMEIENPVDMHQTCVNGCSFPHTHTQPLSVFLSLALLVCAIWKSRKHKLRGNRSRLFWLCTLQIADGERKNSTVPMLVSTAAYSVTTPRATLAFNRDEVVLTRRNIAAGVKYCFICFESISSRDWATTARFDCFLSLRRRSLTVRSQIRTVSDGSPSSVCSNRMQWR